MISNLSAAKSKQGNDRLSDDSIWDFREYTPNASEGRVEGCSKRGQAF
jgi:hypothetical protein